MFELKNKDIPLIYQLLFEMELPFKLTRKRAVFLNDIQKHFIEYYEKGKNELINQYASKDDNGNLIEHEQGGFVLSPDNILPFQNEMNILDNEFYQLDVNEVNKNLLTIVYEIVSTEEYIKTLKGELAVVHNQLCDELERVLEI